MNLLELFCHVDDFWQAFAHQWEQELLAIWLPQRRRRKRLCESEVMTLVIHFHQTRHRDFKSYCAGYVQQYLRAEVSNLSRIVCKWVGLLNRKAVLEPDR